MEEKIKATDTNTKIYQMELVNEDFFSSHHKNALTIN